MQKKRFKFRKEYIICTVIPFAIPFILEIPEKIINRTGQWLLIAVLGLLSFTWIYRILRKQFQQEKMAFAHQSAQYAFLRACTLNETKRKYLVEHTYENKYFINRNMIPYNIHHYIGDICNEFGSVISEITSINKEHMSVSFIYRYIHKDADDDSRSWKWILGKEQTTAFLEDSVKQGDVVSHNLIPGDVASIFYTDKKEHAEKENPDYFMSVRDENHNRVGSILSVKIVFGNNTENLVEGILAISSYGKKFVGEEAGDLSESQLKNLIMEEILPYYQRSLENELGALYLSHVSSPKPALEKKKKSKKRKKKRRTSIYVGFGE